MRIESLIKSCISALVYIDGCINAAPSSYSLIISFSVGGALLDGGNTSFPIMD